MAELRKEHEELKAEMVNFRREHLRQEVGLALPTQQPQPQSPSQETELTRLIRKEMASFNARFSVLEGKILRPPLAADQGRTSAPTYAAQAAAPRAAQSAPAAGATQKRNTSTAASQMKSAGPKSDRQSGKEAKLAEKTGATVRPVTRENGADSNDDNAGLRLSKLPMSIRNPPSILRLNRCLAHQSCRSPAAPAAGERGRPPVRRGRIGGRVTSWLSSEGMLVGEATVAYKRACALSGVLFLR
ncbi:hypothetical protein HF086_017613 [Spodoptera exigua]|uniref:Uncharacterized protein n=1 Tax=Spodoptera exigua TaxID=7107 RepID=A0A922SIU3_SPOEX|nr:hypothetical protein HF086_017613 [Spodoptera exigua]